MARTSLALTGLLVLLLSACTPGQAEVPVNDRVAAADRTEETPAEGEGGGEEGGGAAAGGPVVAWAAGNALDYTQVPESLPVGPQTFELTCENLQHNVHLEGVDNDRVIVECSGSGTVTGNVEVPEPGTYTYYCSIAGHREAGMEGEITAG
jgi:plastocyanin